MYTIRNLMAQKMREEKNNSLTKVKGSREEKNR